jgi:hypothetical protein
MMFLNDENTFFTLHNVFSGNKNDSVYLHYINFTVFSKILSKRPYLVAQYSSKMIIA